MKAERRLPHWLKKPLPRDGEALRTSSLLESHRLSTVCQSAKCPNLTECYSRRIATFMIMGDICTRKCGFCGVTKGLPHSLDDREPFRVAAAAKELSLKYVVITSVTRDDIPDGGASHFAATIREVKRELPDVSIEVLVPDFCGNLRAVDAVLAEKPDIFNHNIETVPRLYPVVRPQADYERSLQVLKHAKKAVAGIRTKSGLMLGIGETDEEVIKVMNDLRNVRCDMITIGQYLQPGAGNLPVAEFVLPIVFKNYENLACAMGFSSAFCGPFVRSSYHAAELAGPLQR